MLCYLTTKYLELNRTVSPISGNIQVVSSSTGTVVVQVVSSSTGTVVVVQVVSSSTGSQ